MVFAASSPRKSESRVFRNALWVELYVGSFELGSFMVAMPHWGNQLTNAKFINYVWKTGVRIEAEMRRR
ncbi:UDP-glycosyltransferase 74E1 [Linum grandiflorum]